MSLEKYKMVTMDWIEQYIEKLGIEEFTKFEAKVNYHLDKLRVNHHYNIEASIPKESQELFIKFCCCYINQHPEYCFNGDYTEIKRYETHEQLIKKSLDRRTKKFCCEQYRKNVFDPYL